MIVIASPEADVFSFHCNVCLQIQKRTFTEMCECDEKKEEKKKRKKKIVSK